MARNWAQALSKMPYELLAEGIAAVSVSPAMWHADLQDLPVALIESAEALAGLLVVSPS